MSLPAKPMAKPTRPTTEKAAAARSLDVERLAEGEKRIVLDVPARLHKALKRAALERGVTMKALVLELLEKHAGIG